MRSLIYLLLLSMMLFLAGCTVVTGSGKIVSEEREVSGFHTVALTGSGVVTVQQGDEESLVVEADDNVLPLIEAEVRGDTLSLGFKPGATIINPSRSIRYLVTVPNLNEVVISGSGTVNVDRVVDERFAATISGSGEMNVDSLTAANVRITISGSGDANVAGAAETQDIQVSGSGNYLAGDLASQSAEVNISGSGNATIWVAESLDASVSGSGDISYYGNPRIDQQATGSGRIRSLGDK